VSAIVVTRVRVRCDATNHLGRCAAVREESATSRGEARTLAARDGWAYRDGRDLCPSHATKEPRS
jgi:hypothetical protein